MSDRADINLFPHCSRQLLVYSSIAYLICIFICWYCFYFLFFYPSFIIGIEGVLLSLLACLGHMCLEAHSVSVWYPYWLERNRNFKIHRRFSFMIGFLFVLWMACNKTCLSFWPVCGLLTYFILQEYILTWVSIKNGEPLFRRMFCTGGNVDGEYESWNRPKVFEVVDNGQWEDALKSRFFIVKENQESVSDSPSNEKNIHQRVEYLSSGALTIKGQMPLVLPENEETSFYNVVFLVPFEKKPTFEYEINSEDIEVKINSVQPYGVRLEVSWGDRENVPDAPPILEYYAF